VRTLLRFLMAVGVVAWAATAGASDASFDYLYIVSNEGGSSGGHTAVRFGRDVYHFQNEGGLLVLKREPADEFFYTYAMLGNRTIHVSRIGTSEATVTRLVEQFRQRHRAQEAQLDVAESLRADWIFLERSSATTQDPTARTGNSSLPVRGLGYFQGFGSAHSRNEQAELTSDDNAQETRSSLTLRRLRDAIVREHGADFLPVRRRALIRDMRALSAQSPTDWTVEPATSAYAHPAFARSYSDRWRDLAAGLAALHVLDEALPLASQAYSAPIDEEFALSPDEIRAFEHYSEALTRRLVALIRSKRSDWGQTLLVGMARLSTMTRSIDTGRLTFLDTFPEASISLGERKVDRAREVSSLMLAENRTRLNASRDYFRDNLDTSELAWERVEEGSNRYFEMLKAFRDGHPMRLMRGHLVPSLEAPYQIPVLSARSAEQNAHDLKAARARERDYSRNLRRLHRYGLIDRNCATALFETINDTFDDSILLSQQQLGGHIGRRYSMTFIPFVSDQTVNSRYSVISRETILSYRQRRIQKMKSQESTFRVALRESNTFTATSYEHGADDSFFVFFTEESLLLRPVFGLVNLTSSLGQSLLGIATAPVDRGDMFMRGLRGAFVSLPEIVFSNIRKGSNQWIPTEHRDLDSIPD
jgi:hypothetical protein